MYSSVVRNELHGLHPNQGQINEFGATVRPRGTLLTWQKIYRVTQNRVFRFYYRTQFIIV